MTRLLDSSCTSSTAARRGYAEADRGLREVFPQALFQLALGEESVLKGAEGDLEERAP